MSRLEDVIQRVVSGKEYSPTDEQISAIRTCALACESDQQSTVVTKAVAGSGKTATMVDLYKVLERMRFYGKEAIFLSFSKAGEQVLIQRGVKARHAKTVNALGHRALSGYLRTRGCKVDVKDSKLVRLARLLADEGLEILGHPAVRRYVVQAVRLMKAWCVRDLSLGPDSKVQWVIDRHRLYIQLKQNECMNVFGFGLTELIELANEAIVQLLRRASDLDTKKHLIEIDYDDQVYQPVLHKLSMDQFGIVVVDEAQDLSMANKHFISASMTPDAALILVGDDHQNIFSWRGCHVNSLSTTCQREGVLQSPLTYNFRSGPKIIENAQALCPEIKCGRTDIEDAVDYIDDLEPAKIEGEDCAILSMLRAPLVGIAIALLKERKPFTFKQALGFINETMDGVGFSRRDPISKFEKDLERWAEYQMEIAVRNDDDRRIQEVEDLQSVFEVIIKESKAKTVQKLLTYVDSLKEQIKAQDGSLELSTMHGSKGREWDTTYLIGYEMIGWRAGSDWEKQESSNLRFVAVTRAKRRLVFVNSKKQEE